MASVGYFVPKTKPLTDRGGGYFYARKAVTPQSDRLSCVNALVAQQQSGHQ